MVIDHTVLCVDDDPEDLQFLREALNEVGHQYKVITASDGVEALNQLQQMKESGELPCLIVLDVNMPKMDGKQTFSKIRNHEDYSHIPIVIFSTSNNPMDKLYFNMQKVEYFTKPINFENFVQVAGQMLNYCHTPTR